MWDRIEGMAAHHNRAGWRFTIDGERVSEGLWKRRYIAALEAENRALRHALELRGCEEAELKPDPLDGVPFVSLSNEEIAAMTPEHPLYKLVKGDRSK